MYRRIVGRAVLCCNRIRRYHQQRTGKSFPQPRSDGWLDVSRELSRLIEGVAGGSRSTVTSGGRKEGNLAKG